MRMGQHTATNLGFSAPGYIRTHAASGLICYVTPTTRTTDFLMRATAQAEERKWLRNQLRLANKSATTAASANIIGSDL